jgi:hypothetical protein
MRILRRTIIGGCAAVLLALGASAAPAMAKPDQADFVQPFADDVYVIVGSTLRHPDADTAPDAPLYNVAGALLGPTWGDFRAANGRATAKQVGGASAPRTDVRLSLTGLVPNGVYSLFYFTLGPDSENPLCPGVERGLPLWAFHADASQPDAASFSADSSGAADFHARVDGALLDAQVLGYYVIYHWFGGTYGSLPNRGEFVTQGPDCRSSFGDDAMRQIIVLQNYY